jgi:hypothetical protein
MRVWKEIRFWKEDMMELENLMQQLNSYNHNKHRIPFQIIDSVKLKMRVKETNEETKEERWTESRAVHVVYFCNMKIEVSTSVARIRNVLYVWCVHLTKTKSFHRDKPILSSDRLLHEDYDSKGSVAEKKKRTLL